jgi:thiol-disulfide isomerase/thioredoxin
MLRGVLVALLLACSAAVVRADSVRVGDRVPEFSLAARDGGTVVTADLRGKVVCLDFWATWCATCKAALPALDALARRPGFEDVRFLAVNVDRDGELADKWLAQNLPATKLTLLRDGGGTLLSRFGADGMPALYVIDREGVVRRVEAGYETAALKQVESAIDALVAPRP